MLSPPSVRLADPIVTFPPADPPPANEPIELLKSFRSSVTPNVLLRVTAELDPKAAFDPARNVPPLTVVVPL